MTLQIKRAAPVVAALVALTVLASLGADAASSARPTRGKAIAHRDGKPATASRLPTAQTFSIGGKAIEPTLGLTPGGDIFYAAAGFGRGGLAGTQVLTSQDAGRTWTNTSPRVADQNTMPVSLDPYVVVDDVDGDNARIFSIDLYVACSYMSFSDDNGESWITNPLACGRPVNDHQTLFTGPPATSTTVGYPNVVYYCWNDIGTSSCTKSIDGGITFAPTGSPAFVGVDDSEDGGFCGGLHGHGVVGPDGSVYLPREYCGRPYLAISKDEGLNWTTVRVGNVKRTGHLEGSDPSVAVDSKGNLYYNWISGKNRLPYLSVSKDDGKTWTDPILVGPPGLKESNLSTLTVGAPGKVAIAYYGSENSPFQRCKEDCQAADYEKTTWNGYITMTTGALGSDPLFMTGTVNAPKDPIARQQCGPGRCSWVYDFIDIQIGPVDGIPYAAFVDGCMKDCFVADGGEYEGLLAKLVGGPRLQ